MAMLNLTVYSMRDLQTFLPLARTAADSEITLDGLVAALESEAGARAAAISHIVKQPSPVRSRAPVPCPSPGCNGTLVYWPGHSAVAGCTIIGCLLCRHSEIHHGL